VGVKLNEIQIMTCNFKLWMQGAVHDFETGEGVKGFRGDERLPSAL